MDLRITGLEQVQRALAELPAKTVVKGFAVALDRAAGVIQAAVEDRAPERDEGLLKDSVRVAVEVDVAKHGGIATVGFSHLDVNEQGVPADVVAMWVEFGHKMIGHKPDKKPLDGKGLTPDGSVPQHAFMRPAFEESGDRAIEVFAETLIDSLSEGGA